MKKRREGDELMSVFFNSDYADLKPYEAGEAVMAPVKLNTNENPYPPSPGVLKVFNEEAVRNLHLYEDPSNAMVNNAVADYYAVKPEEVMSTAGSDEAIETAVLAFGKDGVSVPDLSYGFYETAASLGHIRLRKIPVNERMEIQPEDYSAAGTMILLANPNAPTGLVLSRDQILSILEKNPDHIVAVDEAYVDFGNVSLTPLIHHYDNLIVLHTMSKSFSLAGARIGYVIGNRELIEDMQKIRWSMNPYDMTSISQKAAAAAFQEISWYRENCRKICMTRDRAKEELRRLGFTVTDSHTNFLFARTPLMKGVDFCDALKKEGILVRHFHEKRIEDWNRISIGTDEQMHVFLQAVHRILQI
jgi:histidinol-phosphate aminotransferase